MTSTRIGRQHTKQFFVGPIEGSQMLPKGPIITMTLVSKALSHKIISLPLITHQSVRKSVCL